jgi:catechol 2,3-dioxygenase-like lactoylglutathione lyase family enzyme
MLKSLRVSSIYVLDQDKALDFYVGKLGLQVIDDIPLGYMRWLTVGVPGDGDRSILLEKPGPPAMDEKGAAEVRALVTKGRTAGNLFSATPSGTTSASHRCPMPSWTESGRGLPPEPDRHGPGQQPWLLRPGHRR